MGDIALTESFFAWRKKISLKICSKVNRGEMGDFSVSYIDCFRFRVIYAMTVSVGFAIRADAIGTIGFLPWVTLRIDSLQYFVAPVLFLKFSLHDPLLTIVSLWSNDFLLEGLPFDLTEFGLVFAHLGRVGMTSMTPGPLVSTSCAET